MVSIDQIKKLREETGGSVADCKNVLIEAKGDFKVAKEILEKVGKARADKKGERETRQGIVETYVHAGKKIGVMIELDCETDFVAKSADFQKLAHELCLQAAALDPEETPLISQPWIKDESKKIEDLIKKAIAKLGENIVIKRVARFEI